MAASASTDPQRCLDINGSVGISMTEAMMDDFSLPPDTFSLEKTQLILIESAAVDYPMADFYARKDQSEERQHFMPLDENRRIYTEHHPKALIVKFIYQSKNNKTNEFLASYLVNDYECSVRFNSYVIVRRGF